MPELPVFGPPYSIAWLDGAKIDVRHLDRPTAMRIFDGVLHFARTGVAICLTFMANSQALTGFVSEIIAFSSPWNNVP